MSTDFRYSGVALGAPFGLIYRNAWQTVTTQKSVVLDSSYRVWANAMSETDENQRALPTSFSRGAIFASVLIAVPALTSVGVLLVTDNIGPVSHREIVDIRKYPWSSIGRVGSAGHSSAQWCTGAVIGPNQFLTAAHCLYNQRTARFMAAGSIHILLGYEKGEYRAHRVASRYTIPPAFNPSLYTYPPDPTQARIAAGHDWTIVYTDEPFPPDVRPLRLASATPSPGTAVKIGGYPVERPHIMTADPHCRISTASPDGKLIAHDCVTHHGDSGGPLLSAEGDDEGLILGVQLLSYSLLVELREQSKEGGWAVSAASITEFLGSQLVGSLEGQKTTTGSVR